LGIDSLPGSSPRSALGAFREYFRVNNRLTFGLRLPDRRWRHLLPLSQHHPREQLGLLAQGKILYTPGQIDSIHAAHVGLRHA
jgi:hypothetical protein